MTQKPTKDSTRLRSVFIYSLIVTAAAQINVSLYLNNFKISIAVILFPVFLFFWERFPLIWVTVLSGLGVFLSRCAYQIINDGTWSNLFFNFMPEIFFYLVYGILLFLYCKKKVSVFSHFTDFLLLVLIDYAANLTELLLRIGTGTFDVSTQASIILAALFRSFAAFLAISGIKRSHLLLLKREHAERYRSLLLLISKLNGEIIWMRKNTALMEETMNTSYQLYKELSAQGVPESLTTRALQTARDIHEIKKEYFIILRGISDALDLNLKDEGMFVQDLLKLLTDTFTAAAQKEAIHIDFQIKCSPALFTDKQYFLLSVFHNLFTNALEACSGLPEIEISCIQSQTDSDFYFKVEDNGSGIMPEDLTSIFSPGYSTKINYQTGEVSRGLGLNLVQDIIENQFHGSITAASEKGRTTFTICIPKSELKVVS